MTKKYLSLRAELEKVQSQLPGASERAQIRRAGLEIGSLNARKAELNAKLDELAFYKGVHVGMIGMDVVCGTLTLETIAGPLAFGAYGALCEVYVEMNNRDREKIRDQIQAIDEEIKEQKDIIKEAERSLKKPK